MNAKQLIAKYWGRPGGAERATYQMFLTELAQALGADTPDPGEGGTLGNYQFEGPVKSEAVFLSKSNKRIDLYKRDHFILEAKQSQLKDGESLPDELPEELETETDLFGNVTAYRAKSGTRAKRYDRLMADARIQAERYSLALSTGHKPPPFLIVADIGRTFELYFDWSGDGRGYGFFPNKQTYRISLSALDSADLVGNTEKTALELLRAIWLDPESIDPRKRAVAVTGDIAVRLSRVAEQLEREERTRNPGKADFEVALGIEHTSLFLMRVLFCMFAEDVELLPKESFTRFLDEARSKSDLWWQSGLRALWQRMDQSDDAFRFWDHGDALIRYFNGNLFSSARVYDLPQEFKGELFEAAKRDWRNVEPAIFGTLLEQVLTDAERSKLGAHYTPRPYVQRLVNATIADVLTPQWHAARDRARELETHGQHQQAVQALVDFHNLLADQRILDPACGTGNFLYVAMELLLQLESEVLELAAELGQTLSPAVHPNQFLGLERNPRAGVIAELVLWIGWLRHRLANHPDAIGEPVLPTLTNINFGTHGGYDAVLRMTPTGEPDLDHPMAPEWPEADFIVGNPPFIGGKDIRRQLGGDYAEALWKANPRVPKSADFVMQWWDRAAYTLIAPETRLKRFGFVTTNSITQTFSRRVIERYLTSSPSPSGEGEKGRLSLLLAIPDHPWTKATRDAAAVRIAMTVAARGQAEGRLIAIVGESGLETDRPVLEERAVSGRINADLSVGSDTVSVVPLTANAGLGYRGVQLIGSGFIVTPSEAQALGLGRREGLEAHIRPYRNGRDLLQRSRGVMVIDLFGLSEKEVRQRFPEVYQHVHDTVYAKRWNPDANGGKGEWEGREVNRRESYRRFWWIHGEPRKDLRPALAGFSRYIATVETAKHRIFQFLDASILPDNMLIAIGSDDAFHLGVLSSSMSVEWSLGIGGTLEDRPRYNKSQIFDPFPFPDATPDQRAVIAELAEELDATRKTALDEVPGLTMTGLYNLRDLHRSGEPLSPRQQDDVRTARAGIVDRLHRQIDAAVAEAYGWGDDWNNGARSPADIVTRLVALNHQRAAQEKSGTIRWLRPDYQIPRFSPDRGKR